MNYLFRLTLFVSALLVAGPPVFSQDYPIKPVLPINVDPAPGFWQERFETNRTVTLPYCFKKCEDEHRIRNLVNAGKVVAGENKPGELTHIGLVFNDSDVSKTIEGAAYIIAEKRDPELEKYVNGLIEIFGKAQEPDGYLYSIRTILDPKNMPAGGKERWVDIAMGHELYNLGHMYEAGVAWFEATGNRNFLDICIKSADLVCKTFGPEGRHDPPGHQEIEIGLVKLYRVTGEKKYLDMAKFFLDRRGRNENRRHLFGEYSQDHKPVIEQDEPVGHSVRAMYMLMAMADIAALTGDESYMKASRQLWENVVGKKLYITGGIGAAGGHEGFGGDYELPNSSAYCETCAAIANALWNWRLFLMSGNSEYADVMELVLYNGFLSGFSMEGNTFFYPNPLESIGGANRSPWFDCSCCPTNVVRFVAEIPGMAYAVDEKGDNPKVYVNLFMPGTANIELDGKKLAITQTTDYPYDGKVKFEIAPEGGMEFELYVRKPGWVDSPVPSDLYWYAGKPKYSAPRGYDIRTIKGETEFTLDFPMVAQRVLANEKILDDQGKVSIMQGPLVYCLEGIDQADKKALSKLLPDDSKLVSKFDPGLLRGVMTISAEGKEVTRDEDGKPVIGKASELKFIPYYAWAHRRGGGPMTVWPARIPEAAKPAPRPTIAFRSELSASHGGTPWQVVDQWEPKHSNDKSIPFWHTWPGHGKSFWVQCDFAEPAEIRAVEVYWLDETTSNQACKVPESWKIMIKTGDKWQEVENPDEYGTAKDKFNRTSFKPVKAEALRIDAVPQDDWCGGMFELKIE